MTMLVAGHETTAAVLNWALFCLAQAPDYLAKARPPAARLAGRATAPPACQSTMRMLVEAG